MSSHNRDHALLFDTLDILRGDHQPFEAAKCVGTFVLLRLTSEAGDTYQELGLPIPAQVREQIRATLNEPRPFLIGAALERLERMSPQHFAGIASLVDLQRLSEERNKQIIKQIALLDLGTGTPRDLLRLGETIEQALRQGALTDRGAGEYFSSGPLVQLMAELANIQNGHLVHDPTCGAGGGLAAAARCLAARGGEPLSLSLSGQDSSAEALALCRLNLVTHGLINFDLRRGDVLTAPRFCEAGQLHHFDRVLNTPPWGLKRPEFVNDPYGRFIYGAPPKGRADVAFLQHALSVTAPRGQAVLQLPNGVLFRPGAEQIVRRNIVHQGHLSAVVALPTNILPYVNLPSALLVFDLARKQESARTVEFVDAQQLAFSWRDTSPAKLLPLFAQIIDSIRKRIHISGLARPVDIQEIESHEFNLLPQAYIHTEQARFSVDELRKEITDLEAKVRSVEEDLDTRIDRLKNRLASAQSTAR